MLDLDAYFERIAYRGARTPTRETLRALHALHPAAIPFENLDPLLGRPVRLDLDALQQKLVRNRRGGYCFEHNTLAAAVLEALGFRVTRLSARVRWQVPAERTTPRSHKLLRVDFADGAYLFDVGFGGRIIAAPVRLIAEIEQTTPADTVRLLHAEGTWTLQARVAAGWQDIYRFTLEPNYPIDYEVSNWYTSTHADSFFTWSLLMERLTPDARYRIVDRTYTRRHAGGRVEKVQLDTPARLESVIAKDFGIALPADAQAVFNLLP